MRIKHFLIAYMTVFMFTACYEDIFTENIPDIQSAVMKINVRDQFSENTTRADYTGFPATTFEAGDEIGIYAFDGTSYVVSNVRCVKQSDGSWLADSGIRYNEDYTYYAYFPYRSTTYNPSTTGGVSDIDTKFANFINDASNYFWQADQSTKEGYTYSNLMIAKGNVTMDNGTPTVDFTMLHKRGLALFIDDVRYVIFTGNKPCQIDNTKQFLMKPGVETSFTYDTKTYSLIAQNGDYVTHEIKIDWSKEYVTFYAIEDGSFSFSKAGLSYSLDGGATWTALSAGASTPTVTAGNKILWKNNRELTPSSSDGIGTFSTTGNFELMGNIMSLQDGDNFVNSVTINNNYAFAHLFINNKKMVKADNFILPATTLRTYCYVSMFSGCEKLTVGPKILPALILPTGGCYGSMFASCKSLTTAPKLPATTLGSYCYSNMFAYCTSLTVAPELPATSTQNRYCCYKTMFFGCTKLKEIKAAFTTTPSGETDDWLKNVSNSGVFYKNKNATWTRTDVSGVPTGWTVIRYTP